MFGEVRRPSAARLACLYSRRQRLGAKVRGVEAILSWRGLQVEDLGRNVPPGIDAADESAYLALQQTFDHGAEILLRSVLEEGARVAQALILSHFRHTTLGRRETVLEGRDHDVRPGELRPGLGRPPPELV